MPIQPHAMPSVAISGAAWQSAVLLNPPRELSALQAHRLQSLLSAALEAYQHLPPDELIAFEFMQPMPRSQPPAKRQMVLQVIDTPASLAILVSLPSEHP